MLTKCSDREGLVKTITRTVAAGLLITGCVNLTPADAERLFAWTSPHLPAGWSAVLPTEYERGTLVRVE